MKKLDEEDPEGLTAFARYALEFGFEQANRLLARGAKINYTNRDGKTVLTLAVKAENVNTVRYLLGKGADPHYEDLTGKDTCDYAKQSENFANYPIFSGYCHPN